MSRDTCSAAADKSESSHQRRKRRPAKQAFLQAAILKVATKKGTQAQLTKIAKLARSDGERNGQLSWGERRQFKRLTKFFDACPRIQARVGGSLHGHAASFREEGAPARRLVSSEQIRMSKLLKNDPQIDRITRSWK